MLEKHYKKEGREHTVNKLILYYRVQRGKEERLRHFIQRYEKIARECQNAGGELFSDEGMASDRTNGNIGTRGRSGIRAMTHRGGI